jgi:hypothetical protein
MNISPIICAIADKPRIAIIKNIILPKTIPRITIVEALKPEANAFATQAKTPGPGTAAEIIIAINKAKEVSIVIFYFSSIDIILSFSK